MGRGGGAEEPSSQEGASHGQGQNPEPLQMRKEVKHCCGSWRGLWACCLRSWSPGQGSQASRLAGPPPSDEGLVLFSPPYLPGLGVLSSCGTDALDKTAHGGCPESLSRPSPKAGPTGGRAQGKKVGDGLRCGEGPSTSKVPILPPHSSEGAWDG